MPLPKKYRQKYAVKKSGSEAAAFFMFKVVGLTALFFSVGIGADVYQLFFR